VTQGPEEPSLEVERYTALVEASAHFGIVLRSLYETYPNDVSTDESGRHQLLLMSSGATPAEAGASRTVATLLRQSDEILPILTLSTKDHGGLTVTRNFSYHDLVYTRTESRRQRDRVTGLDIPQAIDPDNIEANVVTAHELEDTLKFLGTLLPERAIREEAERKYKQQHSIRGLMRTYVLGKKPE
jgi:hypothetical protein